MSRPLDRLIEHDIETLNDHLPERRIPLRDLRAHPAPCYTTKSGDTSVFRKEEIRDLSELVPDQFQDDVRLPVVILRRMDYGPGIHTVAGNKTELFMIHKVLGYVDLDWGRFASWQPIERLARPQVQLLRRRLPSTTVLGIVAGTTKEKKTEQE